MPTVPRRPMMRRSTPEKPVSMSSGASLDAAVSTPQSRAADHNREMIREQRQLGANRPRASKPKPQRPTKSKPEPEYGKGKKRKPFMYSAKKPRPAGRY